MLLEGPTLAANENTVGGVLARADLKPAVRTVAEPEVRQSSRSLSDEAQDVFNLLNRERIAAGVDPVTYNVSLETAAAMHANDQRNQPCLAGFLTHVGTDGSRGIDRIDRTGLRVSRWGENIACAYTSPQSVMAGWMRSPGHRATALDPRLTHVGIAVAASDSGQLYWVQLFATPRS